MKIVLYPPRNMWKQYIQRMEPENMKKVMNRVQEIFEDIYRRGWDALAEWVWKLDGVRVSPASVQVTADEMDSAQRRISPEVRQGIQQAYSHLRKTHEVFPPPPVAIQPVEAVSIQWKWVPVQPTGIYVPGGKAPLFSTVLMAGVPAQLAGVETILCTPPRKDGSIAPEILYAARLCGIQKIFRIGGVPAIAGMTFGIAPLPEVSQIVGPGNWYVTIAKWYAQLYGVSVDMLAGPSEILILADESVSPRWIAAEMLAQLEHGPESVAGCLTTSLPFAEAVHHAFRQALIELNQREEDYPRAFVLVMHDVDEIIEFANLFASEHVLICMKDAESIAEKVYHAGAVFVGPWSSVVAGDYGVGSNHILPTGRLARGTGSFSTWTFYRLLSFTHLRPEGFRKTESWLRILARAEGLIGHARALEIRQDDTG